MCVPWSPYTTEQHHTVSFDRASWGEALSPKSPAIKPSPLSPKLSEELRGSKDDGNCSQVVGVLPSPIKAFFFCLRTGGRFSALQARSCAGIVFPTKSSTHHHLPRYLPPEGLSRRFVAHESGFFHPEEIKKKKKKVRWQIGMLPKQPSRLFSRQRKSCCSPAHTLLASASPRAILRLSVSRVHLLGGGRRGLRSPAPHASLHVLGYCGARRAPGAARGDTKSPPSSATQSTATAEGRGRVKQKI